MKQEPRDALDRAIDDALATIVAGEPRRVDAASVRKAMGERRASRIPVWFAASAVLIVAIGGVLLLSVPARRSPETIPQSGTEPRTIAAHPTPSTDPQLVAQTKEATPTRARRRARIDTPSDPPYEGLPRLVVDSIDLPEPLATERLDAFALRIERIEIAPLLVSTLPIDPEPKQ